MEPREPLVERYMPEYDVRARFSMLVRATPATTFDAALRTDLLASWVVRSLIALRTLPARLGARSRQRVRPRTLGAISSDGALLEERRGSEIALGVIGRFWALRGGSPRHPISAVTFRAFAEPGLAKSVMAFRVDELGAGKTLLTTETRVLCADAASRRRFRAYWALIGPFSGLIRIVWLRAVRDEAERQARAGTRDGSAIPSPRATAAEGEARGTAG